MTRYTLISYSCLTDRYMHRFTDTRYTDITATYAHRTSVHACIVLSFCLMDYCVYYMYNCSMFPYSYCMIASCYWYGYSCYWTWELLICDMWNPTSIVPVSRYIVLVILFPFPVIWFYAINRAQVQLSCYPYHVLYLFLLPCILDISDHKDNLGMGETRRLIRSYRVDVWIHCSSHCRGRGSAGYRLLLMLHVSALAGWSWSQQPGVW